MCNHFITRAALLSLITMAGHNVVFAQSSVQCTIGPNGQLQAALVWRNTLGTERADALCRNAPMPTVSQKLPGAPVASIHQPAQYQQQYQQQHVAPAIAQQHRPMQPQAQAVMMNHPAYQQQQHTAPAIAQQQYRPIQPQQAQTAMMNPAYQQQVAMAQHSPPVYRQSTTVVFDDSEYVPMHSVATASQSASVEFVPMYQR